MSRVAPAVSVGIDFGTSNTVVALASADGQVETLRFEHGDVSHSVYASTLCFWQNRQSAALPANIEGGPWAIERFLEGNVALRFIQSFKTFAASKTFHSTTIFRQKYLFEDLLLTFLRTMTRHAGEGLDLSGARVNIGRPVRFAGGNPDDALAMARYRDAFGRLGAGHARYIYEPVGAAFSFARNLEHDATVLVADFGGGTTDFSVLRFSRKDGTLKATPLGHSGIGIAGDTFDARIVDHVISPKLGKGGLYRSFDKVLELPVHFYATLARWNELAMMKGSADLKTLRELARFAVEPAPLHDFIALIENDLGFSLYRAVSAAKIALSTASSVAFTFGDEVLDIRATIERADFEDWIKDDLDKIGGSVDQVLDSAGLKPHDIEKVFLTGGTSFVPAVHKLFATRFGADKLTAADQFESIAQGLALIGFAENPDQWAFGS